MSNHLNHNILNNKRSRSRSNSSSREKAEVSRRTRQISTEKDRELMQLLLQVDSNKKTNCETCKKDISKTMKFVCSECTGHVACVDCLVKDESNDQDKHSRHDYHIIDKLGFPIFSSDWTALEELLLLNGKINFFQILFIFFILNQG